MYRVQMEVNYGGDRERVRERRRDNREMVRWRQQQQRNRHRERSLYLEFIPYPRVSEHANPPPATQHSLGNSFKKVSHI